MEDQALVSNVTIGEGKHPVTAVFDGHNGGTMAQYAKNNFCRTFHSALKEVRTGHADSPISIDDIWNGLKLICTALAVSFFQNNPNDKSGTTANIVLQYREGETTHLITANVGDARAVLIDKNGKVHPLSRDQKPQNQEKYIKHRNGVVAGKFAYPRSIGNSAERVIMLRTGRAIGDRYNPEMNPRPKITVFKPQDFGLDSWDGCTLVQCCDGVFDVLTNENVVQVLGMCDENATAEDKAKAVVNAALNAGTSDNVTAIVTPLGGGK